MRRASLAICDQSQLFREGLRDLLRMAGFTVNALAQSVTELVEESPDQKVFDIFLVGIDVDADLESMVAGLGRMKTAKVGARIVIIAQRPGPELVHQAIAVGVDAVLSKDISRDVLQRSLALVMLGQQLFPARAGSVPATEIDLAAPTHAGPISSAAASLERHDPIDAGKQNEIIFSEREARTLQGLVNGHSNRTIARDLDLPEGMIKGITKTLFRKARVKSRTQAAVWGVNRTFHVAPLSRNGSAAGPAAHNSLDG